MYVPALDPRVCATTCFTLRDTFVARFLALTRPLCAAGGREHGQVGYQVVDVPVTTMVRKVLVTGVGGWMLRETARFPVSLLLA